LNSATERLRAQAQRTRRWLGLGLKRIWALALGVLNWLPGTTLAGVVAVGWLVWWWSGEAGSLQRAAQLVRTVVPQLHGLDVQAPEASLRHGGHIASVRWQQPGLTVVARHIDLRWQWPVWYHSRQSPVALTANVQTLQVDDQRPPGNHPASAPDDLTFPWAFQAQVRIHALQSAQWPRQQVEQVQWQQSYQPGVHGVGLHTTVAQAVVHAGANQVQYNLNATLQDAGSMNLQANLQAQAQGERNGKNWQGTLTGELSGPLAGPHATVQAVLHAQLQGDTPSPKPPPVQAHPQMTLQATLQPWQTQPVHELTGRLNELNLATWLPGWPRTAISGQVTLQPHPTPTKQPGTALAPATHWQLVAELTNPINGPWNQGQLPLARLQATARGNLLDGQLQQLNVRLAGGHLEGQGSWSTPAGTVEPPTTPSPRTFTGALKWQDLQAHALHSQLPPWAGSGRLTATPTNEQTRWQGSMEWVANKAKNIEFLDSNKPIPINRISQFSFEATDQPKGYLIHQARLALDDDWLLQANGSVTRTTTQAPGVSTPSTTPNLWALTGQASLSAPGLEATTEAPNPDEGSATVQITDLQRLQHAAAPWLRLLDMFQPGWPAVNRMGQPLQGQASLQARWGRRTEPTSAATLASPPGTPVAISGTLTIPAVRAAATSTHPGWAVQDLTAQFSGTTQEVHTQLSGQLGWNQLWARVQAQAQVQRPVQTPPKTNPPDTPLAQIRIPQLHIQLGTRVQQLPPTPLAELSLTDPVQAMVRAEGWQLSPGTLEWKASGAQSLPMPNTTPAQMTWQPISYRNQRLSTQGEWRHLHLATWLGLQQLVHAAAASTTPAHMPPPQIQGDLTLQGQWRANWPLGTAIPTPEPSFQIQLGRTGGDLTLPMGDGTQTRTAMGIRALELHLTGQAHQWGLQAHWDSQRLGKLSALLQTTLPKGEWPGTTSPLTGRVDWTDTNLALWSGMAPPGWRMGGLASLQANLSGTLGQPEWQGDLQVRQMGLRSLTEGLVYENGELFAQLTGQRMTIQRFRLEGAGGQARGGAVEVQGHIDWPDFNHPPSVQLDVQALGLNVSTRADRRLTLSGQAQMGVQQGTVRLRGNFKADQARFRLPDETAPTPGSDVVVRMTREAIRPPDPTPGLRTDVDVFIDLGPDFALEGLGVDTRLKGKLRIVSPPASAQFSVTGEVQTWQGTYRAYGQRLNISQGVLRFSGPYDDPALDILALRTIRKAFDTSADPAQEVGVRMAGSARQPVLRLYAKPDLPDADKLAFLVLGRSASGAGAEAALLQQAAVALLAGSGPGMDATLARTLGLDDVSFQSQTGTTSGAAESNASLLLGKRLSDRLYVAYEHSLSGSVSAISLFYDLSRRLTLRARAGQTQALDLIATVPHD